MIKEGRPNELIKDLWTEIPKAGDAPLRYKIKGQNASAFAAGRETILFPLQRFAHHPALHRKCALDCDDRAHRVFQEPDRYFQETVPAQQPARTEDPSAIRAPLSRPHPPHRAPESVNSPDITASPVYLPHPSSNSKPQRAAARSTG